MSSDPTMPGAATDQDSLPRQIWTMPELSRFRAGDAEVGAGINADAEASPDS